MELDTQLRRHQAETATKTLQLERLLAQRQADLKGRTQEVEDITKKYSEAQLVSVSLSTSVYEY